MEKTYDLNIRTTQTLLSPRRLKEELPMTEIVNETVTKGREEIKRILRKEDPRILAIVGPCSLHDLDAASEYAYRLNELRSQLEDRLCIVMRVYFEKPRTTIGWKGLVYDPHLDGSADMPNGLKIGRRLLLEINGMGLPAATEMLDPITPQYTADLICWAAIGARTTESQTHREMASGLSMPVGFKNSTDGNLQVAMDAMESARHPHSFLGIDQEGRTCVVRTTGNPWRHVVLRGGGRGPNYEPESIEEAARQMHQGGLDPVFMVDCSHANSGKKHELQEAVCESVVHQRRSGNDALIGVMIESNLNPGNQEIPEDLEHLQYGVSITDECVGWETTERMLRNAHAEAVECAEVV